MAIKRTQCRACVLPVVCMLIMLGMASPAALAMRHCENRRVLGVTTSGIVRFRSEHYRAFIENPELASARFLPYALMSAYSYGDQKACGHKGDPAVSDKRMRDIQGKLGETTDKHSPWVNRTESVLTRLGDDVFMQCEDGIGFMYYVWDRKVGNQTFVVVAFRGTSGQWTDWFRGNFWWVTRAFPMENQYGRARQQMKKVIEYYENTVAAGQQKPRFVVTGHSLGGGLAQHMLYAFPEYVEQAIVFDSSPVTAHANVSKEAKGVLGCGCLPARLKSRGVDLGAEARIIRVYLDYEILSLTRLPHKMFLGLPAYVQEVRFNLAGKGDLLNRHDITAFVEGIVAGAKKSLPYTQGDAWLTSHNAICAKSIREEQQLRCHVETGSHHICPARPFQI